MEDRFYNHFRVMGGNLKTTRHEVEEYIKKELDRLKNKYPNDKELGKKLREYVWK